MKIQHAFIFIFLLTITAYARVYVSTTGSDETGEGTYDKPFSTIQKAVDSASTIDTIILYSGHYHEHGIRIVSKDLTLTSYYMFSLDTSDICSTIVDGDNTDDDSGFVFYCQDSKTIFSAFSIINGSLDMDGKTTYGGAVYCDVNLYFSSAELTFNRMKIYQNRCVLAAGHAKYNYCSIYSNGDTAATIFSQASVAFSHCSLFNNKGSLVFHTDNDVPLIIDSSEIFGNSSFTLLQSISGINIDSSRIYDNNIDFCLAFGGEDTSHITRTLAFRNTSESQGSLFAAAKQTVEGCILYDNTCRFLFGYGETFVNRCLAYGNYNQTTPSGSDCMVNWNNSTLYRSYRQGGGGSGIVSFVNCIVDGLDEAGYGRLTASYSLINCYPEFINDEMQNCIFRISHSY
ncbi:MAG: hypothetical protein GX556_14830 [Fibrobacter sp.]|nr:hypothetical protein [Fibrobacter sp.]